MKGKLKIGEYVRTREGYIGILIDINMKSWNYLTVDCKRTVRRDHSYPDSYLYLKNEDIFKHSKNITDLIEVGDIVIQEDEFDKNIYYMYDENFVEAVKHDVEEGETLKSILTREEFENREYKI